MTRRSPVLNHEQLVLVHDAADAVAESDRPKFFGSVVDELLTTCDPSTGRVIDAVNNALRRCRDEARP